MINTKFKIEVSLFGGGWIKSGRNLLVASTVLVIFYFLGKIISFLDGEISRITKVISGNCLLICLILNAKLFFFLIPVTQTIQSHFNYVPAMKVDTFPAKSHEAGPRFTSLPPHHLLFQKCLLIIVLVLKRLIMFSIIYRIRNSLAYMPRTNALDNWILS